MNNEEKKLSETESVEEVTATNGEAKKQLPLGALIGIIAGAVAVVVAVALVPENLFDLLHAVVVGGVKLKQFSDHRGFVLVNHKMFVVLPVAEDTAVT